MAPLGTETSCRGGPGPGEPGNSSPERVMAVPNVDWVKPPDLGGIECGLRVFGGFLCP